MEKTQNEHIRCKEAEREIRNVGEAQQDEMYLRGYADGSLSVTSEIKDHYIKEERERIIAELEELKVAIRIDMTMAELNWNRAISKAIEIVRGRSENDN